MFPKKKLSPALQASRTIDLGLGEAALLVRDGDLVGLARGLVLGVDVEDTVGIDVEGDLDLRDAARRRGDALEVELAEDLQKHEQNDV